MTSRLAIILASTQLAGCFGMFMPELRPVSARHVACPEDQIVIEEKPPRLGLQWTARGCDREWDCFWISGQYTSRDGCEETPSSKARTMRKVVTDRLALETGCPASQVAVTKEADWTRGTEQAYRMAACGKSYVCTTAAGRTDCKAALGE